MARIDSLGGLTVGNLDVPVGELGDGYLPGDILTMLGPNEDPTDREQAARRIARHHLRRQVVFHVKRWYGHDERLAKAFERWTRDVQKGGAEAWQDLVEASAYICCTEVLKEKPQLSILLQLIRRRLRPAIEKELLGHLLDAKAEKKPVSWLQCVDGDHGQEDTTSGMDSLASEGNQLEM